MWKLKAFSTVQILIFYNLLLALVAFIKDMFMASYFGTSKIADAINLAFFIPDTIGNNLIGAAIAVSSIPVLTNLAKEPHSASFHTAIQRLITYVFLGTLVVWGILACFSAPVFRLFHFTIEGNSSLDIGYFHLMAPIVVAAPLWLLGSSVMQANKYFILPAATPIIYNLFLLIGLAFCQLTTVPQAVGANTFSILMTIATFLVCLMTWIYISKRQKLEWNIKVLLFKDNSINLKKVGSTFTAYLLILLFSQSALLVERFMASSLETGTIAALSYVYRISQFPIWVFIAAVNTFILPTISIHIAENDVVSLKRELTKSFILVISISAILSLGLVVFSEPLIQLLLGRGSFTIDSAKLTSTILKGYGLSIVGQSLYVFCTRYYVAEGKMRVPLTTGLIGSLLNIALLKVLVPLQGAIGIGYAAAISSTVSGILILAYFMKNLFVVEQKGRVTYE